MDFWNLVKRMHASFSGFGVSAQASVLVPPLDVDDCVRVMSRMSSMCEAGGGP